MATHLFTHLMILFLVWGCETREDSSGEDSSANQPSVQASTTTPPPNSSPDPAEDGQELILAEFMQLLNQHRRRLGLRELVIDLGVSQIAEIHSENMAHGKVTFGHSGFSSRCSEARVILGGGNLCSENVAMGQKSASAVFTAWMNSSGHRANMENPRVSHTGFAHAKNSQGSIYWTQIFIELD